ncbi:MAG: hypothetical protein K2I00_11030, partial [Ruminococcus sp.]|nr:hypothetical protein [Ruminococcus sp.]
MIKLVITNEYNGFDFVPWMGEKLNSTLESLGFICSHSLDKSLYKEILNDAIHYLTTIYNAVTGGCNIKLNIINEYNNCNSQLWVKEKINHALNLVKILYDNSDMEKECQKDLIFIALCDIITIYNAVEGIDEISSDKIAAFIINNDNGWNNGKVLDIVEDDKKLQKIFSLITNDPSNRTYIAELLAQLKNHNSWSRYIQEELEEVHMGNKTWNE